MEESNIWQGYHVYGVNAPRLTGRTAKTTIELQGKALKGPGFQKANNFLAHLKRLSPQAAPVQGDHSGQRRHPAPRGECPADDGAHPRQDVSRQGQTLSPVSWAGSQTVQNKRTGQKPDSHESQRSGHQNRSSPA